MKMFLKKKIQKATSVIMVIMMTVALAIPVSLATAPMTAEAEACCEVTLYGGQTLQFDSFVKGWAFACYKAYTYDYEKSTTLKLLSNWDSWTKSGSLKYNGHKYKYSKYDMGFDISRRDVGNLDDSKDKIDCFDDGHLYVPEDTIITIDLNGYNLNRQRWNNQDDDGEVIRLGKNAKLTIMDSRPDVKKSIEDHTCYGGVIMGGSSEDNGGGIRLERKAKLIVKGCNICCNQTSDHGGAIYVDHNDCQVYLYNTYIFCNKTRDSGDNCNGAGVYLNGGKLVMDGVTFETNSSEDYGGAIYSDEDGGVISAANCKFIDNYCRDDGGAIYMNNGALELTNCTFYKNGAGDEGGAIYMNTSDGTLVDTCTFTYNYCDDRGGAMYADGENMYFADCTLTDNYAKNSGGAIFVEKSEKFNIQGLMQIYNNKNKSKRADNLFIEKGATLYSGGLSDGSRVGISTNKTAECLIDITQWELEHCFFTDVGYFSVSKWRSNGNESVLASVFSGGNLIVICGVLFVFVAAMSYGIVKKKATKREAA